MAFELVGETREDLGRSGSRRLRRQGRIPAIVYGGGEEPRPITLGQNDLLHEMDREGFYTSILTIKVGKDSQSVVVKAVQRHPARTQILHLDFQRIVADQQITLNVPIRIVGEIDSLGIKEGGVVDRLLTDIEVSCLPRHLPEYLEIDVSALEINQLMHLSDIALPEGVSSVALDHDQDQAVVAINPPRREEIDERMEEAIEEDEIPPGEVPTTEEDESADDASGD
ncbi:50S ribosomal protein L25/general stress protein Ctc [Candidatus Rariloculus sp.]|uniref:50S ribosomal protein L25/general stress protein Ctc n=1 Tax=Candidatus Rariloculus sp. TaxID=3101265 RepID=UPI003D0EE748